MNVLHYYVSDWLPWLPISYGPPVWETADDALPPHLWLRREAFARSMPARRPIQPPGTFG
jgi:hypothetical protein